LNERPLALITGASSGIGRCIAILLARKGFRTVLMARREPLLRELCSDLNRYSPSDLLPLDFDDTHAIEPAIRSVLGRHGPINVVINSAGFGVYAPFSEQSSAVLERLMRVNHEAPTRVIRAVLPTMVGLARAGELAHVMNVCSASARMGPWGHAGYAASKGAMRAMTEVLASEFAPQGLKFTIVYPGIIRTPYFDHGGMGHLWDRVKHRAIAPERVAQAVVSRLGHNCVTLYVPGHYRLLDLINAISPRTALAIVRRESRDSAWNAVRPDARGASPDPRVPIRPSSL
jgi:short-subunit dehydrogenase